VDDYAIEIADLQAQVERLIEAEEDRQLIADLQMQVEVLQAIYRQAVALHQAGRDDRDMRHALAVRGYGEWTLDSVYAFVYESAVDLPSDGHHSFVGDIRHTDFGSLLAS